MENQFIKVITNNGEEYLFKNESLNCIEQYQDITIFKTTSKTIEIKYGKDTKEISIDGLENFVFIGDSAINTKNIAVLRHNKELNIVYIYFVDGSSMSFMDKDFNVDRI